MTKIANDIKKNTKDPFVHNILSTQMINNFIFDWYIIVYINS